jgi:stage II sporulation protein AA (anti-sigma F factor antagonist)
MTLSIKKEIKESTLFVQIIGLMDYSTMDDFQLEIPSSVTKVVIDFTDLDFIDSTIYSTKESDRNVEFIGLNQTVIDLFETIGVFRVMEALKRTGE